MIAPPHHCNRSLNCLYHTIVAVVFVAPLLHHSITHYHYIYILIATINALYLIHNKS